jgi:hypothetical protein
MPASTDARQLLQDVVTRYGSFTSYADEGSVRQQLKPEYPDIVTRFSTLFRKPAHFRFEFSRPHSYPGLRDVVSRTLVVSDGASVRYALRRPQQPLQIETMDSLARAVARATGVSSGSVHHIGRLLLPEVSGLSLLDLVDAQLDADATIGPMPCYRLTARHPRNGAPEELWIEKDTLLIRKRKHSGTFPAEETRENVRVNEPLDEALFNGGLQ